MEYIVFWYHFYKKAWIVPPVFFYSITDVHVKLYPMPMHAYMTNFAHLKLDMAQLLWVLY